MWEGRSTWSYNTDLTMSLAMYIVDFAHHVHILVRKKETLSPTLSVHSLIFS